MHYYYTFRLQSDFCLLLEVRRACYIKLGDATVNLFTFLPEDVQRFVPFLSPPVQLARWAHIHRFLSVVCRLSGLDQKS